MVDSATFDAPLARASSGGVSVAVPVPLPLLVTLMRDIETVEPIWRRLEAAGIESPGQSYDFVRQWITARAVPAADQLFVVAALAGHPIALLPLQRFRRAGISHYGWFPGTHVGCGAPLIDTELYGALSSAERTAFWQGIAAKLDGADFLHLAAVPEQVRGLDGPFTELGRSLPTETLYRASFASWDEANTAQRSKSRRKHDRQQGERLEALGKVEFEVVGNGDASRPVLEEMFRQRARRFEVMGVADPFAAPDIARFYRDTVAAGSGVEVKLHVLRLDGEIVAVRYNIVFGDRLFCLISSMSDDERIQGGSPGKQCLLRVMQTEFDAGFRVFDMGNGFTDEKRHWCNERIALRSHYVPLTLRGRLVIGADALWQSGRAGIKANPALLKLAKGLRAKLRPQPAPAAEAEGDLAAS